MSDQDEVKINLADPHVEQTLEKLLALVEARRIPTLNDEDIKVLKFVAATIHSIKAGVRIFGYFGVPAKAAMFVAGAYLFIKEKGLYDALREFTKGFFK